MAVLKDIDYKETELALEYKLSQSEFYSKAGGEWVSVVLTLKSGRAYPEVQIKSDGQEVYEVEQLIKDLHKLAIDEIDKIDFEPLEPDYNLILKHSGRGKYEKENFYEVWVVIDAQGSRGGTYFGRGLAIHMAISREAIKEFAVKLNTELYKVKKGYKD